MAFQFKEFQIEDDNASMKVGTDGVLLGAWAGEGEPEQVLDIGTGCGLIALMMAQRFPTASIVGIDIHKPSVLQAADNFARSPWHQRLKAEHLPLQEFTKQISIKYDIIVANPPFFINSLLPPDPSKKLAKHNQTLSYSELIKGVCDLLGSNGIFYLILPFESQGFFEKTALNHGLKRSKRLEIIPRDTKEPNRVLSSWAFNVGEEKVSQLKIRNHDGTFRDEYRMLTRDFYLAL